MNLPSTLRLDHMVLMNYRCFDGCEIAFDPSLTVLVAENGSGKTALLDAVAIALDLLVATLADRTAHGFKRRDVRLVRVDATQVQQKLPTELDARGLVDGGSVRWRLTLPSYNKRARTLTKEAQALTKAAKQLRLRLDQYANKQIPMPPLLPLVAYYGTGRLWNEQRLTQGRRTFEPSDLMRTAGYADCLTPTSSFKAFSDWFASMSLEALKQGQSGKPSPHHPTELLSAVSRATDAVLEPTGWHAVDWDYVAGEVVIDHDDHGRLPLSLLSDGVRTMVALSADVAHRCVRLNPHLGKGAVEMTPGVLLIDEVDMHLHPRWQQMVLAGLRRAFPAMQMIVTTHSPQVISTVEADCIRVVEVVDGVGRVTVPDAQTRGVASSSALAKVMGVSEVPDVEEAGWVADYRVLVQTGQDQTAPAVKLWSKIRDFFGPDHAVVNDLATLQRFQAFRRERGLSPDGG